MQLTHAIDIKKIAAVYFVAIVLFVFAFLIVAVSAPTTGVLTFGERLAFSLSWIMMVSAILLVLVPPIAALVKFGRYLAVANR